jgi:protein O-GlcNAc transferase
MIAGTQELQVAIFDPSFDSVSPSPEHEGFWSPIRKLMTMNLLGYIPTFESMTNRTVTSPATVKSDKPVVTYVDRQKTGRRLNEESHQGLVEALRSLEEEGICELQIVKMEDVGLKEQIRLIARSAVSRTALEVGFGINVLVQRTALSRRRKSTTVVNDWECWLSPGISPSALAFTSSQ